MTGDAGDLRRIGDAIGQLMRVAGSERVHARRQEAAGTSLSQTEMRFLAVVDDRGPLPVTALGAVLHVSQPTASRTLRRLEEERLVRRRADRTDGRVARYEATAAGRRLRQRFQAVMDRQLEEAVAHLTPARRRQLADLLEELVLGSLGDRQATGTGAARKAPKSGAGNGRAQVPESSSW